MTLEEIINNTSHRKKEGNICKSEENILIQKFSSVDDLKNEIRQKIASHESHKCESMDISTNGEFISISFRVKN